MRMFLTSLCLPLAMLLGGVLARDDQSSLKAIRDSDDQNVLPQILDKLRNIDQRLSNIEHQWNDQNMRGKKVPFSITRVEKRETMEIYRVKVMYEGSERPTSIAIGQKDRIVQLLEPVELGDVEFDVPRSAVREVTFITFFLPDHTVTATLYVAKSSHSMDLPHLQFQILQGKDVQVNYPEEHLQLDYISEIEKIDNLLAFDSLTYQILLKSDKEDHVIERYNALYSKHTGTPAPATLDIAGAGGSGGYKFGRYVLNSTVNNAEGMINFLFGAVFRCSQPCLVQTLQDVYTVKFYPKGQEPPFPQKSMNFIHDDYRQNKGQFYCSENSNDCQLSCEVLGEGLTSIEISRIISQDENQATPDISVINGVWGKSQLRLQNVSFEEAGEYLCEARSATNEASEVMNLVVVEPAKIIEQMSNVTHFENGTVLFTCVADGYPAPTITFERMDRSPMDKVSPEAQVLHLNSRVTLADLYLADPELVGNVFGVFCDATNVPGSRSLINNELIDSKFLPIDPLYENFDRIESQW